jgi:WD40 repeat protein
LDQTARLWDARTGALTAPALNHAGPVTDAVFSPNGRFVLTGSADGTARLWDAVDGSMVSPPLALGGAVTKVAFSADGLHFLAGTVGAGAAVTSLPNRKESASDLVRLAQVLSGSRLGNSSEMISLRPPEIRASLSEFKARYPRYPGQ